MGEIAAIAGGGSVLATAITLIGYLLASNRSDRSQYEDAIDRADKRAEAAEQRTREAWQAVEEARRAQHKAEDALRRGGDVP